ncbi:MAG TPA: penicillin acylase family protein, partial [Myxococcaceae bacterium]|nr:penicillin acylase family protein [Myxococcaceae bacterium]
MRSVSSRSKLGGTAAAAFLVLAVPSATALASERSTLALKGVTQPVEIVRDRWGIPHIFARTAEDMFFAQGFNAARDRLWQLDLWRRQGEG